MLVLLYPTRCRFFTILSHTYTLRTFALHLSLMLNAKMKYNCVTKCCYVENYINKWEAEYRLMFQMYIWRAKELKFLSHWRGFLISYIDEYVSQKKYKFEIIWMKDWTFIWNRLCSWCNLLNEEIFIQSSANVSCMACVSYGLWQDTCKFRLWPEWKCFGCIRYYFKFLF